MCTLGMYTVYMYQPQKGQINRHIRTSLRFDKINDIEISDKTYIIISL